MKKLLLIPLLMISLLSFSQHDSTFIQKELKSYRADIVVRSGMGLIAHTIGFMGLINSYTSDPLRWNSFIIYNSVGITFDILAITKFIQYRKYKRYNGLIKTCYR